MYECKRCGNKDPTYFGINGDKIYCKKCIMFKGKVAEIPVQITNCDTKIYLEYSLSKEQQAISDTIVSIITHMIQKTVPELLTSLNL